MLDFKKLVKYTYSMSEETKNMDLQDDSWCEGLSEMCVALAKTSDQTLIQDFLACLLTPAELHDVSNRWRLVKEIKKGTTQREVAHKFGMSLCKITRGSKELKKPNSAFAKMLESVEK